MSEVANIYVSIGARLDGLERGLARAEAQIQSSGRRMDASSRGISRSLGSIGAVAATGGLLAAGVAIGKIGRAAMSMDSTMAELAAKTGASRKELDQFRQSAERASTKTRYSANEAAGAQLELAKAGLTAQQILGGGLASALDLAAAGNMGLGDAAVTSANALNLFKLQAKDLPRVADAMAGAANATSADVKDMADALKMGGGAAKAAGLSFDETMTALTVLAAAGYKGSDAGTSLKTTLLSLAAPVAKSKKLMKEFGLEFFDASGKMKGLGAVSEMLREKTKGLTEQQRLALFSQIAGTDGVRTLLALYDAGKGKIDKYAGAVTKTGEAHRIAGRMNQTAEGQLRRLGNTAETAGMKFANRLMPYVSEAAGSMADSIAGAINDGTIDRAADLTVTAVGRISSAIEKAGDGDVLGAFRDLGDILTPAVSDAEALRDAMHGAAQAAGDMKILRANEATAAARWAQARIGLASAKAEVAAAKKGSAEQVAAMGRVVLWTQRAKAARAELLEAIKKTDERQHKSTGDLGMGRFSSKVDDAEKKVASLRAKLKELEASPGPFTNADADVIRTKELPQALAELAAAEEKWTKAKQNADGPNGEYLKNMASHRRALALLPPLAGRAEKALGRLTDNLNSHLGTRAGNKILDWTIRTNADQQIPRVARLIELADKAGRGKRALQIVANADSPKAAIQGLLRLLNNATGKKRTSKVDAAVSGKGDVDALIASLARLVDKTVHVTTYYDSVRRDGERHGAGTYRGAIVGLAGGGIRAGRVMGSLGRDSVHALLKPGERVVNEWQWGLIRSGVDPDRAMSMTGALRLAKGFTPPSKKSGEDDSAYRDRVRSWGDKILDAQERQVNLLERSHARMQRQLERDGVTSKGDLQKIAKWQRQEARGYVGAADKADQLAKQARRLGFSDVAREWAMRARDLRESAKDRKADAKDTDARKPDEKQLRSMEELLGKDWEQAQLEAAKASTTKTKADDIAALQKQKKLLEKLVRTTKRRDILTQAYSELASVQDRIASLSEPDSSSSDSGGDTGGSSSDSGGYSGGSYGSGGATTVNLQQYITVQGSVWVVKDLAKELRDEFIRMGREMGGGLWAGVG